MSQGQWEQHQPVKVIDLGASPATGDGSRQVDVRVPGPAWPTSQFSTVKGGMSRDVGRGFCCQKARCGRAFWFVAHGVLPAGLWSSCSTEGGRFSR